MDPCPACMRGWEVLPEGERLGPPRPDCDKCSGLGMIKCATWPHPMHHVTCACCKTGGCPDGADGFGKFIPWRDQLADKSIDAIVAVAPPDVTTEVALACAAAGKPVMATKPLFDHPEQITAPFYVDFWRLWSEAQRDRESDNFFLHGAGPIRSFPGAFDYGPHVMAAILNIDPMATLVSCRRLPTETGELLECDMEMHVGTAVAYFGNGSKAPVRDIWGHTETPTHIGNEPKEAIMQKFCRSFMSDVSEGFVSTDLLNYSREGMRLLRQIREEAK